jgi:nitrate/TMAO reductase-like tetraheme cytochrome c subunit
MNLKEAALYVIIAVGAGTCSLMLAGPFGSKGPDTSNWLPARKADLHAPALSELPEKAEALDSEWLDNHWKTPIPAQGEKPEGWSDLETDLSPESCGTCHPSQYADWKESWHAKAMGPGVIGQLLDRDEPDDGYAEICQACHAPLTEQHPFVQSITYETKEDGKKKKIITGEVNPDFDESLRARGLTCAGCHVRNWKRHGPPQSGDLEPVTTGPHGGFVPKAEYQDSKFCYRCHDFRPGKRSLNDKLIQETYQEWRRTKYAEQGVHCQDCHMPEGRHLFKGVHDADMVAKAFTADFSLAAPKAETQTLSAKFKLTNTGAGHRFPTYVTPQVNLVVWQVDAQGDAIEGTRKMDAIARKVSSNIRTEYFDTRLMPDESYTFDYQAKRHTQAVALQAAVEVWPDENYTLFYRLRIKNGPEMHPTTLPLLQEALDDSLASRFTAWEQRIDLP